jgi:MFS family permease
LALLTLFLARALDGLTGGNVAVANAYLADISEASDRKRHYGWMTAAGSIGMIAGPALSGLLGGTALAEKLPILAAVVISALALGIIARFLPERGQPARPAVRLGRLRLRLGRSGRRQPGYSAGRRTNPRRQRARRVWAQPAVRYILIMYFLMFLGFNVFYTAFPVHAAETLAWSPLRLGLFFSVLSGVLAFVEGPVLGALARRFSDEQLVIAGGLILASNFLLLLSPALPLVYASAVLFALGNGLMWPSFLSVLSKTASEQYQGTVQGLAGSAGSIASIVGLILGGLLYRYLGPATFGVAAGLMFGFWLLSWRLPSLRPGAPLA